MIESPKLIDVINEIDDLQLKVDKINSIYRNLRNDFFKYDLDNVFGKNSEIIRENIIRSYGNASLMLSIMSDYVSSIGDGMLNAENQLTEIQATVRNVKSVV
jgi:hypothetical protein